MTHRISTTLLAWYETNKRELPWREITDPYCIWVSEIILQQTRVIQGMNYYIRFIDRFPNVAQLADAHEDEVLKYWQGLGYYSRARNLHKAANQIITEFCGTFPKKYDDIIKLAGIGEYTAAAICSFAYNLPYAVVDGNVYRVLARLLGINTPIDSNAGKKEFTLMATELLSKKEPGLHNQAIMEFGALQCVPVAPNCSECPLSNICKAYEQKTISSLPVKASKTKVTQRFFNYLFINLDNKTYLQKRTGKDVWQNLFEFPLIESDRLLTAVELTEDKAFRELTNGIGELEIIHTTNPMKHVLSHRVIFAQFFTIRVSSSNKELKMLTEISLNDIDRYAVSRLMELFIQEHVANSITL